MTNDSLAPIILFVYNRPWHTQQTIDALKKNELADQSDLIIYSDAPKNDQAWSSVQEVRDYIKTVDGFKSVKIIERDKNWGLAANIIDGVTEVVNQYGKIIVMEDDIVTSPAYLQFMNQALDFYQNEKKVWHITGWNEPIKKQNGSDAFLWRLMNCWGWATWVDRWVHFEKDTQKLIEIYTADMIKHFNLDGFVPYWLQVLQNKEGVIDTWAVYWYATIHLNDGLCLNPLHSYVDNIGHDGSGVNCGKRYDGFSKRDLCSNFRVVFPSKIYESEEVVLNLKYYFIGQRKNIFYRIIARLYNSIKKSFYS